MSVAVIHKSPPASNGAGLEALEFAFAFANLEQNVGMFFIDDGVYQLLKNQDASITGYKNHLKSYSALPFYDIENVYVCRTSLSERGISADNLCVEVILINDEDLSHYLERFQHVVTF